MHCMSEPERARASDRDRLARGSGGREAAVPLGHRALTADELARIPASVTATVRTLQDAGHATAVVGGAVRDLLRGAPVHDWDLATAAEPAQVAALFPRVALSAPQFGTVRVAQPDDSGLPPLEVTTFRRDGRYVDGRHPESVGFATTLAEDVTRRDFTVNALALDPVAGMLLDHVGGAADLAAGVIRAVGDPEARLREDALRLLRAVRFSARLGFRVDPALREALRRCAPLAAALSAERVRDEFGKMLALPRPSEALALLADTGLLAVVLPELDLTRDVRQNVHHAHDVFWHTLHTIDAVPADKPRVRWAALFHDIGKPATRVIRDGDATFHDHQVIGADLAERVLARLRVSRRDREHIGHLVHEHMFDYQPVWTDAALRRFMRRVGPAAIADLFDLRLADDIGNGRKSGFPVYLDELRARVEAELDRAAPLDRTQLAVDGRDVIAHLGIAPGPAVKAALDRLLEAVLEHPEWNTRARLLDLLTEPGPGQKH